MRHPILLLLLSAGAFAQTKPPAFEIADIHASPTARNRNMRGGLLRGGRYELHQATMVDLIRTAYGVEVEHVIGGPAWLEADRFEVLAKSPPSATAENVQPMLRALLADRFHLVVHEETRPMPAFVLSQGKGKPKIKEADGTGEPGCRPGPFENRGGPPSIRLVCHSVTMETFGRMLRDFDSQALNNRVVDSTDLKGLWDLDFRWSPRGFPVSGEVMSVFEAVDKQLGLKLEAQRVPTPVVIVDSVNRRPTDNLPGVTTRLPPPQPQEFEVAVIKPSAPGATPGGRGFDPNIVDFQDIPLRVLITMAWEVPGSQELFGAPKWLQNDSPRFDLMAKPARPAGEPAAGRPSIPFEDMQAMIRALLADRFKMATHYEDRPMTAYTLAAAKPKLKAADPSNRTKCKTEVLPRREGVPGPPPLQVTCVNMSMAQFAEQLQNIAPSYLQYPVLDGTGIEGAWDFTFTFSRVNPAGAAGRVATMKGAGGRGGAPGPPGNDGDLADPTGTPTLFEALSRLGLKLEAQKRPVSVLVIDHLEEKPTEN